MVLRIADVAERLSITVRSARRLIASGVLSYVKHGGIIYVDEKSIESFLESKSAEEKQDELREGSNGDLIETDNYIPQTNWCGISSFWKNPGKSSMNYVDMFCGCGGFSKGLDMAGFRGVCGTDWMEEAGMTYRRNFNHAFVGGDIREASVKKEFYATVNKALGNRNLDLLVGGFPYQGFSTAGNLVMKDPRNPIYREIVSAVKTLRPRFVVLENVKGLRSIEGGAVEARIVEDFKSIGYRTNVATLCAADYYVPQKRERVIFIANRVGLVNFHPKPILNPSEYETVRDAIDDLMLYPEDESFNHVPTVHTEEQIKKMLVLPEGKSLYEGYGDAWKRCKWNEPSCTIKENHGGLNIHPLLPRVITAREMARLQSFTDDFIFEGKKTKQLVQIGNAVPPLLGKAIGLAVRYSCGDFK